MKVKATQVPFLIAEPSQHQLEEARKILRLYKGDETMAEDFARGLNVVAASGWTAGFEAGQQDLVDQMKIAEDLDELETPPAPPAPGTSPDKMN